MTNGMADQDEEMRQFKNCAKNFSSWRERKMFRDSEREMEKATVYCLFSGWLFQQTLWPIDSLYVQLGDLLLTNYFLGKKRRPKSGTQCGTCLGKSGESIQDSTFLLLFFRPKSPLSVTEEGQGLCKEINGTSEIHKMPKKRLYLEA